MSYDAEGANIVLLGTGGGGAAEFVERLSDDMVGYGLVKKIEKIDESETTKFCFVRFVGDNIPRMLRARLGTHSGFVASVFNVPHFLLSGVYVCMSHKSFFFSPFCLVALSRVAGSHQKGRNFG
jgi:hypothetical protein